MAFQFLHKLMTLHDLEQTLHAVWSACQATCHELTAAKPILSPAEMQAWESSFGQNLVYVEYLY